MIVNVHDFGMYGDGVTRSASLFVNAIEAALSGKNGAGGAVVHLPAGHYRIDGPVTISRDDFEFYRLRICGDGKSQSVIRQGGAGDVLVFENTGAHYSAELSIRGLGFFGGDTSVRVDSFTYSDITDCGFRGTATAGGFSVDLAGITTQSRISDCWFYHGGDAVRVEGGGIILDSCHFGEDVGAVWVDGLLRAVACSFDRDMFDRGTPAGYLDMGAASVTVKGGSRASFTGCSLGAQTGGAFVNLDQANSVDFAGCDFTLNGGALIRSRRMFGTRGVTMVGCQGRVMSDAAMWKTVGGYDIRNARIRDTRIWVDSGEAITIHPDLTDPTKNNVWEPVIEGVAA